MLTFPWVLILRTMIAGTAFMFCGRYLRWRTSLCGNIPKKQTSNCNKNPIEMRLIYQNECGKLAKLE